MHEIRHRRTGRWLAPGAGILLVGVLTGARLPARAANPPDCGTTSLVALAQLIGRPIPDARVPELARAMPETGPSMLDVKRAAEQEGIAVKGVGGSLEEVAGLKGPAIIHLSDPDHFVVLVRLSDQWAQAIDSGMVAAVPRGELEMRYSGQALVMADEAPKDGGRVEIGEFHWTFGISGIGQTVEHTFVVSNAGNRPLMVEADNCKSCGAPEVTVAEEILAPGKQTEVKVKFTVTYSGNVAKSARLKTNDPRAAVVYLTLHGTVPHDLQVQPAQLHLAGDKNAVLPLTLTVSGPADMNLTGAACDRGRFDVHVGDPHVDDNGKKTWTLSLSLKARDFVGRVEDQLTVRTTHAQRPVITIPIAGEVRGDLVVQLREVFFGFVKTGAKAEQRVRIASRSGAPFTVKSAKLDSAVLRLDGPVRADDGSWGLTVSLGAGAPGVIDTKLVLATDVPGEGTIEVPVYAHLVAQGG